MKYSNGCVFEWLSINMWVGSIGNFKLEHLGTLWVWIYCKAVCVCGCTALSYRLEYVRVDVNMLLTALHSTLITRPVSSHNPFLRCRAIHICRSWKRKEGVWRWVGLYEFEFGKKKGECGLTVTGWLRGWHNAKSISATQDLRSWVTPN